MSKSLEFPTTRWTELFAASGEHSTQREAALTELVLRYRAPLMAYLTMKVGNIDRAQDMFQEFFVESLAKDFFGKADRERGRFRAFLKASIDRFLIDKYRRQSVRTPAGGFVEPSINLPLPEPVDEVTPESVYVASWIQDVIARAVERYQIASSDARHALELSVIRNYLINPCIDGDERPSLQAIAESVGLTRRQAQTLLERGSESLREFLLAEINIYSLSENETADELADIYRVLNSGASSQSA